MERRFVSKLALMVIGLFMLSVLTMTALVAAEPLTLTSSEHVVVSEGAPFQTAVILENAEDVVAFQLRLHYDDTRFEVIGIQKGPELAGEPVSSIEQAGLISINYSDISKTLTGGLVLFTVSMRVIGTLDSDEIVLFTADEGFTEIITMQNGNIRMEDHVVYNFMPVVRGLYGDVNLDGRVSIFDAVLIQLYLADLLSLTDVQKAIADVNGDGRVSVMDVVMIQLYLVGKVPYLGPVNAVPTIEGVEFVQVPRGIPFDPLEGVTAHDPLYGDLTAEIVVEGSVNEWVEGVYTLTYRVSNSEGVETVVTRDVMVVVDLAMFEPANGTFNYRFADAELRHTLFAAAERYLMETMAGGIPVFSNAGFVMYSSRLQLPIDSHIPALSPNGQSLGFGPLYGTMSLDDSHVLMANGQPGNAGEYTYRSALGQNPDTLNHWEYTDATSAEVISLFLDSLYYFRFNDTLDGYVLSPSMAAALPQPVEAIALPTGVEVSNKWRISIRDDLVWTYHPNTDTSAFPVGHETINAHTFVDTYRVAIENGWFRATSGGGHFWSASQEIVNARLYHDTWDDSFDALSWDEVGIRVIDDYTVEFQFIDDMDEWAVTYWLSSFVMTPINFAIYESLSNPALYGTTPERTAYTGNFILESYQPDVFIRYSKNPNFHDPNRVFYTHYTYAIIDEALIRFQEFMAGKLDGVAVPATEFEGVQNDPRIRLVPGATTFRIMINGLGTPARQQEQFQGSTYIPEPILSLTTMKQAMFFAIDRQTLAEEVLVTSHTQMYYFTSAYMVEPLHGIPYRTTLQGQSVGVGLSPETFGFNSDIAMMLFKEAVAEAIALGYYQAGTPGSWTEIELELLIFSGSEAQVSFGNFIKNSFEAYLVDDENYVRVLINVSPRAFPGIYFDYMMTGEFDISIGGISGSTMNAASFLDVFADDNRGGFTLNWGIDTTTANIPVTYFDFSKGEYVNELWSFNALASALNGTVTVVDGQEAE